MTTNRGFERPVGGGSGVLFKLLGKAPTPFAVPTGYQISWKTRFLGREEEGGTEEEANEKKKPAFSVGSLQIKGPVGTMKAGHFPAGQGTGYYLDQGRWMAISPDHHKSASTSEPFPFASGPYDVTVFTVGENDEATSHELSVGGSKIGAFVNPLLRRHGRRGRKYS